MRRALKIALWCLVVGLVLAFVGLDPFEVWRWAADSVRAVALWLADVALWAWPYVLAGAVVVIPILAVRALLRARRRPPAA